MSAKDLLRQNPEIKQVIQKEVSTYLPEIPCYNAKEDNTDEWKEVCNIRKGMILCLAKLGIEVN